MFGSKHLRTSTLGVRVKKKKLVSGMWQDVGGSLNTSGTNPNYLALVSHGGVPYVAWQEKSGAGNYKVYVKHSDGGGWVADSAAQNVSGTGGSRTTQPHERRGHRMARLDGERAGSESRALHPGPHSRNLEQSQGPLNAYPAHRAAAQPSLVVTGWVPLRHLERETFPHPHAPGLRPGRTDTGTAARPTPRSTGPTARRLPR